jgi:hypothetical protein
VDLDPAFFVFDLQSKKNFFFISKFFYLLLLEGPFTSFFKNKKAKRSHKTVKIMVFLTILLHDRRFRIWDPDPDEPKNVWIWDLLAHLWYF